MWKAYEKNTSMGYVEEIRAFIMKGTNAPEDEVQTATYLISKIDALRDELSSIEYIKRQIKSYLFTLIAIGHVIKGDSRDQIISELKKEDWFFKHEVLTRWFWMSAQKNAAQKGASFNKKYLCQVSPL
ncbi:MAG: hypothetical protein NTY16_08460, partial [Deltaproteobacteria bacterium]|nr:hypothetical protein [Deltaproteobacteria bacterium]